MVSYRSFCLYLACLVVASVVYSESLDFNMFNFIIGDIFLLMNILNKFSINNDSSKLTQEYFTVRVDNNHKVHQKRFYFSEIDKAVNKYGDTRLHRLIINQDFNGVKKIIKKGADVNFPNYYGITPLAFSAISCNKRLISLLLLKGAKTKPALPSVSNPFHYLVANCEYKLVKFFLKKFIKQKQDLNVLSRTLKLSANTYGQGFETSALLLSLGRNKGRLSRLMIKNGADVNMVLGNGWHPLLLAILNNDLKSVQALVANGARVLNKVYMPKQVSKSKYSFINNKLDFSYSDYIPVSYELLAYKLGHFEIAFYLINIISKKTENDILNPINKNFWHKTNKQTGVVYSDKLQDVSIK